MSYTQTWVVNVAIIALALFTIPFITFAQTSREGIEERRDVRMEMRIGSQIERAESRVQSLRDSECPTFVEYHEMYGTDIPAFCNEDDDNGGGDPDPLPPAPTLTFDADPDIIDEGDSTAVSWNATNADTCTAWGGWSGSQNLSGSMNVLPGVTTMYTLQCEGEGGVATYSLNVVVIPEEDDDGGGTATTTTGTLTVVKNVINDDGGTSTPDMFMFTVNGVATTTFDGSGTTTLEVEAGTYTVNEVAAPGYTTSYDNCSDVEVLAQGETVCVITNDDIEDEGGGNGTTTLDHVVISEVYYDVDDTHGAESSNEWVELYNPTDTEVDLSGYLLADAASSDALPEGANVPAGGYMVVTSATTTEGFWTMPDGVNIVVLEGPVGNGLGNSGDVVMLQTSDGLTTIDAVSWGSNTDAFDPSADDVPEGSSLMRTDVMTDSHAADDWMESETPTPGE